MVEVAKVRPAIRTEHAYTGVVAARVQSDLGFRVPGKVIERLVDAGQAVRQGQHLMRIDATDYTHAISAQKGDVAAARARWVQAAADEERYRGLVDSGATSQLVYDQAKAAADGSLALLDAAQAQLKVAHDDATYSALLADADGIVIETFAEPGQVVAAGQIVVRLAHAGSREASVNLPETVRPEIGSTAQASLYQDRVDVRSVARLRQLSDAADPLTRTYEARYIMEGAAARAPIGSTVTLYLSTGEATATAVPLSAVDDDGHGPGVWLLDVKTSSVSLHPVRVTQVGAETAVVSEGLTAGEEIVAMGGHFLHQGQRVRVAQNTSVLQ